MSATDGRGPAPAASRMSRLRCIAMAIVAGLAAGCVVYEAPPGYYSYTLPSPYDRAWSAAGGALHDAGVQVVSADPATGVARGSKDGVDVTVSVARQAAGTTRVQFDAKPSDRDPGLAQRFSDAYERRRGR